MLPLIYIGNLAYNSKNLVEKIKGRTILNIFHAVILGVVQGLAEFLPVSSSGHLIIFQTLFGITEPTLTFDIVLHLGTLVAVFIVYRREIWGLIKNPFQKMTLLIIVATIPAVAFTLLFGDFIDSLFNTTTYLAFGFFITGLFLLYADNVKVGRRTEKEMGLLDALIIGCMQGIAIAPAISRSGSTITGALSRRLNREAAARFSFLMSIPAILGAAVLQMKDLVTGDVPLESLSIMPMALGFITAAISGYLAISFMIELIKRCKLKYFSYYVFLLGAFILADQLLIHKFF